MWKVDYQSGGHWTHLYYNDETKEQVYDGPQTLALLNQKDHIIEALKSAMRGASYLDHIDQEEWLSFFEESDIEDIIKRAKEKS
jgi:hypothetical protein